MQEANAKDIDAEWVASVLGDANEDLRIRLHHKCSVRGPALEATLLAHLARMRDRGHLLEIDLPESALSKGDIESIIQVPRRSVTATEKIFTDRVVGVLLSHFGRLVGQRDPVRQALRAALESDPDGAFGNGNHRAAVWLFDGLPTHEPLLKVHSRSQHPRAVNPHAPTQSRIGPLLSRLCRDVTGNTFASVVGREALKRVESFAMQAIENAYEHATTDVLGRPILTANLLQVRRVDSPTEHLARSAESAAARDGYLAALAEEPGRFCEIQIADGGPGIGARMTGKSVRIDIETERRIFGEALRPTGTTKAEGAARGLGIPKILAAAAVSKGLVSIRSGNVGITTHFVDADRRDELLASFPCRNRNDSIWRQLDAEVFEQVHRTGTQVSLLIPDRSGG